jgi:hypothetical protein
MPNDALQTDTSNRAAELKQRSLGVFLESGASN